MPIVFHVSRVRLRYHSKSTPLAGPLLPLILTSMQPSQKSSVLRLVLLLILCYAVAAVGSVWTVGQIPHWYASLAKPSFSPPNWIFGPVWTLLYGLMAVAAWLAWKQPASALRGSALVAFFVQLALNLFWSLVFFRNHLLLAGLVDILLLWAAILFTTVLFWRLRPLAGALLLPYLLWVGFASALNAAILRLN